MKLIDHFNNFLADAVNLNATRVTTLENSASALKTFIKDSDWGPKGLRFSAHGSWSHKTIIKPVGGRPFDADMLAFVKPVTGWEAKDYIRELRQTFLDSTTYKDKVRRYSHCVTIEYAGERKIDIAPVVVNRDGVTGFAVCNFDTDTFERTAPEDYTAWLSQRNQWTGGNGLKKATRLLKYLRDIKTTFTCPSFLLTTLLGMQINSWDAYDDKAFADVPTALKTIVARLDNWLQANATLPTVYNPVLASEVQSSAWDDTKYANFRDKIHTYRGWIDDAYDEVDRDESIGKWRRVFGEDFAASVVIERAASVSSMAAARALLAADSFGGFNGDLVALYSKLGARALPDNFDRLPHKQRPRWRQSPKSLFGVSVDARLHSRRRGPWVDTVAPDRRTPLSKGQALQFQVRTTTGLPVAGDFDVHWRVTNTDQEAKSANQMRGEFVKANDGSSHWEDLAYRGVHSVEAFVVRKRDQVLVAQSAPFYVVVD